MNIDEHIIKYPPRSNVAVLLHISSHVFGIPHDSQQIHTFLSWPFQVPFLGVLHHVSCCEGDFFGLFPIREIEYHRLKISFLCFQWLGFSQVPCSNMQPAWLRPCGLDECQFLSLPATPRRVWSWWSIPGDDPKFTFLLGGLKISSQTTKSGWWFGTWILFSPIVGILGWWSNLTNSIIFQGGRYTTNEKFLKTGVQNDSNTTKLNK